MTAAYDRLYTAAGAATTALTAAPWLTSPRETETGTVDRTLTLWTMLGQVNDAIRPLAVVGVLIIAGFAVSSVLWRGRTAGAVAGFAVLAWLTTITVGIIMAVTDGGFRPGTGAWVTLVVTAGTAVAASIHAAALTRAPAIADQRR